MISEPLSNSATGRTAKELSTDKGERLLTLFVNILQSVNIGYYQCYKAQTRLNADLVSLNLLKNLIY